MSGRKKKRVKRTIKNIMESLKSSDIENEFYSLKEVEEECSKSIGKSRFDSIFPEYKKYGKGYKSY